MATLHAQKFLQSGIVTAIFVFGISDVSFAQQNAPTWIRFQVSRVKPEMRQEYEGHIKQIAAAYKKTGAPFFVIYQNFAGDMTEYTSVLPIMKFAEMDGPSPLIKTFGEEVFANLVRDLTRCTTSQLRYFSLPMDDLTINKGPLGITWMLTRTFLNPGKFPEYQAWLKNDYKPALEKAGVTQFRASRPIFGLPGGEVQTIRLMKNFAEIDGGPILTQKLGADAARALNAKTNGLIRAVTTTMIRVRPDLSYLPAPPAGSN